MESCGQWMITSCFFVIKKQERLESLIPMHHQKNQSEHSLSDFYFYHFSLLNGSFPHSLLLDMSWLYWVISMLEGSQHAQARQEGRRTEQQIKKFHEKSKCKDKQNQKIKACYS